ncbi:hypothetical protein, partial [Xanthomonas vasicola]|uniref:hypothetical protein n=1 Tax=Xanthomonas vasicola TaxID=56459 RepID=UPI001C972365
NSTSNAVATAVLSSMIRICGIAWLDERRREKGYQNRIQCGAELRAWWAAGLGAAIRLGPRHVWIV